MAAISRRLGSKLFKPSHSSSSSLSLFSANSVPPTFLSRIGESSSSNLDSGSTTTNRFYGFLSDGKPRNDWVSNSSLTSRMLQNSCKFQSLSNLDHGDPRGSRDDDEDDVRLKQVNGASGSGSIGDRSLDHIHQWVVFFPVQRGFVTELRGVRVPVLAGLLAASVCKADLLLQEDGGARGFRLPNTCPYGCASPETEAHIFKECQFAKRVWFASRLNIRTENIENPSMTDWICQLLNNCNPGGQDHYHDVLLPILTSCWSIYMQRNEILFQRGKADIMECLQRAYRVVDEVQSVGTLQGQDPFFKVDVPRRQIRIAGRSEGHHNHQLKLTCQWTKDSVNGKKVFGIFRHHLDNLQPLCYLVTEGDQDNRLGLLRNLRNLLQNRWEGEQCFF
ncbi:reverse transcriptase [Senna tora]|uniref:Reverse transcriptase n=1 Tax=Senna tora TaxID=362788 RepID=A0A835CEK6_9FABA|nr:reverse transcriptase [Senna tora]